MRGWPSIWRRVRVVGIAVLAATLGACLQNREVALPEPIALPGVATVGSGKAVTVVRPHDARANPAAIGGLHVDSEAVWASARPKSDVAVWIGSAFVAGLKRAGFSVERAETTAQSPTPLSILITVNEVYVTVYSTGFRYSGDARIVIAAEAYRDGQPLFRRYYSGVSTTAIAGDSRGPLAQGYEQALRDALQNLLEQGIPNLAEALAREQS